MARKSDESAVSTAIMLTLYSIINTTSVVAFRGTSSMVDYASSKGAIVGFTRALAKNLIPKGIRVNAVAPGITFIDRLGSDSLV